MELFDKKYLYLEWDDVLKGKKVVVGDLLQLMRRSVNDNTVKLRCVEDNSSDSDLYPFVDEGGTEWAFVYYDPNYECRVAYAQGKQIQYKSKYSSEPWIDCFKEPSWEDDVEYRVKPEQEFRVYKCSDDTLHISKYNYRDFLFEGTEVECRQYIKEHYCDKCTHQSCDMTTGTQFCKGFKEVKKRRMTNRELAKWLAQGNGECLQNTIAFTVWNYLTENKDKTVSDSIKISGWDEAEWHEPEVEE